MSMVQIDPASLPVVPNSTRSRSHPSIINELTLPTISLHIRVWEEGAGPLLQVGHLEATPLMHQWGPDTPPVAGGPGRVERRQSMMV